MLKMTSGLESFLSNKCFLPEKIDPEVTQWKNGLLNVYVIDQTENGIEQYAVFFRKESPAGEVMVESNFRVSGPSDVPAIESFINFSLPTSPWALRDK